MDARAQRPAWWRTAAFVVLCAGASLTTLAYSALGRADEHGWQLLLILLAFVLCFAVPVLLCWRHRWPFAVTLVSAGIALVLPIGTWTALVALAGLISRRRGAPVWWTAAGVAVVTLLSVARDARGESKATSLLKSVFGPTGTPQEAPVELSWWVVPVTAALGVGLAVGTGLLVRARREARAATDQASTHRATSDRLGDQLARQQERERIAREVHDALGHRLSLLNLHAGAVESRAGDNPELAESAALVRQSASRSLEDLRSLLAVLRQPLDEGPAAPDLSLTDLPAVIEETVQAGVPVTSTVYLDGAERAGPTLSRAVYRIVQELLTNARKHAPGQPVRLDVSGGPAAGITIDARNPHTAGAPERGGHGLQGMAERVELLGGRLVYGLDENDRTFRVTAWLPWDGA